MLIDDIVDDFFNPLVAIEGIFTPQVGSPSATLIIFDSNYFEGNQFGDVGVETREVFATVKTKDYSNAKQGDAIVIKGITWYIINAQINPSDGVSKMKLSKNPTQ